MFKFFKLLSLLMFSKIDGGDGAGSGESIYGDLNIDNDDNTNPNGDGATPTTNENNQQTSQAQGGNDNERIRELEKQLEENQKYIEEQKGIQAVNDAIADIKSRTASFDADAVYEHLKELNKTDPKKAAMYNNPIGWENIWNQIKPVDVRNDNVNSWRNSTPVNRDEEVFDLVKNGSASVKDEADVLGKLL